MLGKRILVVTMVMGVLGPVNAISQQQVRKYVRFTEGERVAYGILQGDVIQELEGTPFGEARPTGRTVRLAVVSLLAPCEPSKVIAVGLNYRSHLGDRPAAEYPGLFAKFPTSIIGSGHNIIVPPDSRNLHFEGELVVVIGRKAKNVTPAEASKYIFGVTAGNDVSERDWQRDDLQWFRAKASDTFGPMGPVIVTGLNYNDLLLQTRVNGQVKQSERTSDLIFDVETIVSYVSRYVTLEPGDVIFTGTPGQTSALKPGDVVEVEVEGVGVLRNSVVPAGASSEAR
jgi:2-keto-4-pentenoate hydratase/2-oxohepta-3-ene-1,7-dioic acid hydratase in catechol pathway